MLREMYIALLLSILMAQIIHDEARIFSREQDITLSSVGWFYTTKESGRIIEEALQDLKIARCEPWERQKNTRLREYGI
jgi:hypothetical protein